MRRWLKRTAVVLVGIIGLAIVFGAGWEQWTRWRAPVRHPPLGTMVDVNDHELHLNCSGEGTPTVILESGLGALSSLPWAGTVKALEGLTRICRYDRAGLLWSEPGPAPRDASQIAKELHALLEGGGERPPYVLVGHSLGGIFIRVFDARYPGEVEGFVFVDASHPGLRNPPSELNGIVNRGGPPALPIRIAGRLGIVRLMGRRTAPPRELTPEEGAALAFYPQSLLTMQAEASALDSTAAQGARAGSLDPRPVVVLTAGREPDPRPGVSEELQALARAWSHGLQDSLASLSSNSDHRIIPDAGHVIHMDNPDATAAAIRAVIQAVRSGEAVARNH